MLEPQGAVLNVLEQLPRHQHAAAKVKLCEIVYASTRAEAERKRKEFEAWCRHHGYGKAAVSAAECAGTPGDGLCWRTVRRRHGGYAGGDRRLMHVHTFLDKTSGMGNKEYEVWIRTMGVAMATATARRKVILSAEDED